MWSFPPIWTEDDIHTLVEKQYLDGLSTHGIRYLLNKETFPQNGSRSYAEQEWVIESVFELVR